MWFKLAKASFSTNLGLMSELSNSIVISYNATGFSYSTTSVSKDKTSASLVLTLKSNYEYTHATSNVTVSGATMGSVTYSNGTLTIPITYASTSSSINVTVTGAVLSGDEPETPVNPPSSDFTAVPYTSQLSASGLSKTDGSILSSGTGYVNVYENLDFTKTYYASGYAPGATGSNAIVCYYKADGTFISAESGSDWGISSEKYQHRLLNIPADTAIIKLFGRTNSGEGCTLEIGVNYTLISHSEINEKSNLTKSDGTLGTSASGVVKTYNNIDNSKTYVADGFCPNATGSAAFVCYYNSSNTFISYQDGNNFGLSSQAASKVTLTVPDGTSTIKLFGQGGSSDPYLYTVE